MKKDLTAKICKNRFCKREFLTRHKNKIYCSVACYDRVMKRYKEPDYEEPEYLIWQGIKIKNGCFAKEMVGIA